MGRACHLSVVLLSLAFVVGCGGDTAEQESLSVSELGDGFADAMCNYLYRCMPIYESVSGQSEAECATSRRAAFQDSLVARAEAGIERGTVSFDGVAARDCLDLTRAAGCDEDLGLAAASCDRVFVGSVALGGSCADGTECAGDASCVVESQCPGVCTAKPAAGEPCTYGGASCVDGTECVGSFDEARCMAEVPLGGSCGDDTASCTGMLVCNEDSESGQGSCALNPLVGSLPAQGGEDCGEEVACSDGFFCKLDLSALRNEELSGTCAMLPESGAACHFGFPLSCPKGEWCDFEKGAEGEGLCTTLPGHGQSCAEPLFGVSCVAGTQCVMVDQAGTTECRSIKRLGESCSGPADCHSGSCEGSVCVVDECSGD